LAQQAAASGSLDFKDLLLLKLMSDRPSPTAKARKADSSSEGEEGDLETFGKKGLRSIYNLEAYRSRLRADPDRYILEFEAMVKEDLGVGQGQPWSLSDWNRKQRWGSRHRGLCRAMEMDIAVYQALRSNRPKLALLQVCQNMKAKHQTLLHNGDWKAGWLLTGIPDPLKAREFAGSPSEMAVISGYLSGMADLHKKVGDQSKPQLDPLGSGLEDEEPKGQGRGKKTKAKAKAKGQDDG